MRIHEPDVPVLGWVMAPGASRVAGAERRAVTLVRCAVAGMAAERYRLRHGRWPESLAELVPAGLLREVPADPYSEGPLQLRRARDGLVIHSVGPDGVYDGTALDDGEVNPNDVRLEFR